MASAEAGKKERQDGQRCMALSVAILVGEAQEWVPELLAKAKGLKVGAGTDAAADLGPYGKQVVAFYTQTKTVIQRWFDDDATAHHVNTTISLK